MKKNEHENCECSVCKNGVEETSRNIHNAITKYGHAVISTCFDAGEIPYAYTVGRCLGDKSEYIIGFGTPNIVALAESLYDKFDESENVSVQWVSREVTNCSVPVILLDVLPGIVEEHCPVIESVTGKKPSEIRCRQIVFPDANGLWPWDEGVAPGQFWVPHAEDPAITIALLEAAGLYHNGVTGPVVRH